MKITFTLLSLTCATLVHAQAGIADNTFNMNGYFEHAFGTGYDYGTSCVIQPDGKIIAAGGVKNGTTQFDSGVLRLNPNGTLDNTFGSNGEVIVDISANDRANSVALQPDGKIVVAGNNSDDFCVMRLDASGNPDNGFNTNGKRVIDFGSGDECLKVLLQNDGKILLIGRGIISFANKICVARLNSDGSLDNTFDGDGIATYSVSGVADLGLSGAVQADGKIIVTGFSTLSASGHDYTALRINANGTIDNSFGSNGSIRVPIGSGTSNDYTYDMALYPDEKIIMVGNKGIVRLNNNGTLDLSFNSTGVLPFTADIRSVVLQPNGKIVCGAYSTVYRFNTDGSVDNTFGNSGIASINTSYNSSFLSDVQLQPDGKIVIVSHNDLLNGSTDANFFVARFTGDAITGVNELNNETSISVSPNPCTDQLIINLEKNKGGLIEITEITGRSVYSKYHTENKIVIETTFLNEGLYCISANGTCKKILVKR
jgi:uncharacterized delta-60 repeat protein